MSSFIDYNYIIYLISVQKNLFRIAGPILLGLGIVSNISSLFVFSRKILRKNPCSIYFMALNSASLIYLCASLLTLTLSIGYNISHPAQNLILCRIQTYIAFAFNCICPSYLILASIDRVLITSPNALTRKRSTRSLAYKTIIGVAVFWMLFQIPTAIFSSISGSAQYGFYCYIDEGVYTTFVTYFSMVKEITAPVLMIIFGFWSVKNIRGMGRVAAGPESLTANRTQAKDEACPPAHGKDRQLILMLFIDISIYVLFSAYLAILLFYRLLTVQMQRNLQENVIQTFMYTIAMYSAHVPFCITSYAHLLVSKTFRGVLKNIILCK